MAVPVDMALPVDVTLSVDVALPVDLALPVAVLIFFKDPILDHFIHHNLEVYMNLKSI